MSLAICTLHTTPFVSHAVGVMNIAKALKLKNQLAGEVTQLEELLTDPDAECHNASFSSFTVQTASCTSYASFSTLRRRCHALPRTALF